MFYNIQLTSIDKSIFKKNVFCIVLVLFVLNDFFFMYLYTNM